MGNDICDAISEKEFNPGVRSLQLFKKISMENNQVQSELGQIDYPEDLGYSGISFLNASRGNKAKQSQYTPKGMNGEGKVDVKNNTKDKLDIIEQKVNKLISDLNKDNKAKEENIILSTQGNTTSSKQQKSTNETNFFAHQPKKPSNLNTLYLQHLTQHPSPSYTPIPFPFSVIKLILDPALIKHISQEDPNFFSKYHNDETSFKLLRNGCYGNVMGEGYGVFVNVGYYYQGGFVQGEQGEVSPCGRGVYVTGKGKYVGEFNVKGEMEGRGKYCQFVQGSSNNSKDRPLKITQTISQHTHTSNTKTVHNSPHTPPIIYQGLFQQNTLTKGTIQHPLYRYQGSLLNCKPHGFGKLHLLTSNTTYKGEFKQGKFDGKRATYETPQYTYVGDFVKGRKEGYGVLVKKVKGKGGKGYTGNQRQGERFDGYWRADRFVGFSCEDMGK